ncbi:MAG: alpha/beta fold hydrolase [Thiotrichales bacterium]|jgi:pimeloyl-ACP methyl ester carboxylesterase|nr:alpha/beta fold hydrolase [Thiotrichales bacterium]MBT4653969.1 alpha/beta fold hydrolase [Thiotrichales bacterium]MBT5984944.1 alpha/beta fold hydrolase [Thiotrichales bacterium]MBT7438672.1 alpha/beta fold hydrolase [Thiotrichales bacterium]
MASINSSYSISGSGPAIIFVHGIGARKTAWDKVVLHLKDHFTCISYDLRGHGGSPKGELPYSLDVLVEDLEALRLTLNFQKIHIVGHSLGGMIGPKYAKSFPDNVLSVSLLSTAAFRTKEDQSKVMAIVDSMNRKGIEPILNTLTDRWFTDQFIEESYDSVEFRLQQVLETDPEVFLEVFRIYAETEMSPWLNQIKQPCLVLTGENDGGCNPRLNKLIAESLTHSELCILDKFKHSILIEAPDLVGQRVRDFLLNQ